jgi:hypothetical protein
MAVLLQMRLVQLVLLMLCMVCHTVLTLTHVRSGH